MLAKYMAWVKKVVMTGSHGFVGRS